LPCCINATFNTSTCPILASQTGIQVMCGTGAVCPTGQAQICTASSQCPTSAPKCMPFTIESGIYGVCM